MSFCLGHMPFVPIPGSTAASLQTFSSLPQAEGVDKLISNKLASQLTQMYIKKASHVVNSHSAQWHVLN